MDAKVDDWVVTPRRGKAVEINALWYNALRLMEGWAGEIGETSAAAQFKSDADRAQRSFNEKFWNASTGYLFDVVDIEQKPGENDREVPPEPDPGDRAAASGPRPRAMGKRSADVREQLLTPVGLRSLAPSDPVFKPRYFGDLRTRDARVSRRHGLGVARRPVRRRVAEVHPDDAAGVKRALDGFVPHLDEACIGSVSEVFDAEPPFTPRGCIAQAWSVAELLRVWLKLKN